MRYEAFNYIETSIPEGMTVADYRRARVVREGERMKPRRGPKWFPMPRPRPGFAF